MLDPRVLGKEGAGSGCFGFRLGIAEETYALRNILANNSAKIAHTPMSKTPCDDGCIPARTQAITTPAANIASTRLEIVFLTNSPQCLHFLASGRISSEQNWHL